MPGNFIEEAIPRRILPYGAAGKDGKTMTEDEDGISRSKDAAVCTTDDGSCRTNRDLTANDAHDQPQSPLEVPLDPLGALNSNGYNPTESCELENSMRKVINPKAKFT